MKKILTLGFLLLFAGLSTDAQDVSLYQGLSDIHLRSGTVIKHITLWKIDSVKVAYVDDGNLSESLTSDVLRIVTINHEITFDEQNQVVKKTYDLIIRPSGDTVRGFIYRVVSSEFIEFTPTSGKSKKRSEYAYYVRQPDGKDTIHKQTNAVIKDQKEVEDDLYSDASSYYSNKDLIITKNNDSIWCTILNDGDTKIEYAIKQVGHDSRDVIYKSKVRKYFNNTYNSNFEKYNALNSANYQSSNPDLRSQNIDLIITLAGDHIWCNIIKVGENEIYYHISIPGRDPKIRIYRNLIKEFSDNDDKKSK